MSRRYEKSEIFNEARSYLGAKARNIKANLETLRYLEGEGMTNRIKANLRDDTGHIIIGLGGIGCQKCQAVKDKLYRDCDEDDIKRFARFLFIDTDIILLEKFENNEQVFLSSGNGAAEELANPSSPSFMKWCNPELNPNITAIMGAAAWHEDGANRYRQVGRIKLAVQENRELIKKKIIEAVSEMSCAGASSFRVTVIAGIAGGTGSGIIVDIPYIIRDAVINYPGVYLQPGQLAVEGYILLPPACGEYLDVMDVKIGNRNAYAALKEIDYFMTIKAQHAADPCVKYEFCGIESTENIFDNCFLIDRVNPDGNVAEGRVSELASSAIAHTIVNSMISYAEIGNFARRSLFGTTSYLRDTNLHFYNKVNGANYTQFPKEANYKYLTIGYSEMVVPVDLFKVYLMRKIFDRVYASYSQAFAITEEAAEEFVKNAGLDKKGLVELEREGAPFNKLPQRAEDEITKLLKSRGPYYMLELIREVVTITFSDVARDIDKIFVFGSQEKKAALRLRLASYKNLLIDRHGHDFMVYTVFIEELQRILEEEGQILTDSERRREVFGSSFSWSPIDLNDNGTDAANMAIKKYLDGLVDDTKINRLAENFKAMLADPRRRAEWKWLHKDSEEDAMDAASVVRDFIEIYISTTVNATFEDYLVKFYSGDPTLDSSVQANQDRLNALDIAASKIFECCRTSASPLIRTDSRLDMDFVDHGKFFHIIVPSGSRGLEAALLNQGIHRSCISSGDTNGRVVFYAIYPSIPAYILDWAERAERDYEEQPYSLGLHIEQNERNGLNRLVNLPNLVPEQRWAAAGLFQADSRESHGHIKAKKLFERAKAYGLVDGPHLDGVTNQPTRFSFKLFKRFVDTPDLQQTLYIGGDQTLQREDELVEMVVEEVKAYIEEQKRQFGRGFANISEIAADLDLCGTFNYNGRVRPFFETDSNIRNNSLASNPISFGTNVVLDPQAVSEFAEDMAPRILRKQWHKYRCLELSVRVMERVDFFSEKMGIYPIYDPLEKYRKLKNFAAYLSSGEFLTRDVAECKWFIKDEQNTTELLYYGDKSVAVQYFNLYAAYLEYVNLDADICNNIKRAYDVWYDEGGRLPTVNGNKMKLSAEIESLLNNRDPWSPFPMGRRDFMEECIKSINWINPISGKEITCDELYNFYNNMKDLLYVEAQLPVPPQPVQPAPAAGTWDCPNPQCGAKGLTSKFCPECATPQPVPQPAPAAETWACPACGKKDNKGKFCYNCGMMKPFETQ